MYQTYNLKLPCTISILVFSGSNIVLNTSKNGDLDCTKHYKYIKTDKTEIENIEIMCCILHYSVSGSIPSVISWRFILNPPSLLNEALTIRNGNFIFDSL